MQNHTISRPPNPGELDQLLDDCLFRRYGMEFPDTSEIQEAKGLISDASIAVFDDYITDCPGYAGKLMMVVWTASPSYYQAFTWDRQGQINLIEQDDIMSEERSA